jgi:hypothetical protein
LIWCTLLQRSLKTATSRPLMQLLADSCTVPCQALIGVLLMKPRQGEYIDFRQSNQLTAV